MGESQRHKSLKTQAAGPGGKTEVSLPRGKRLDALSKRNVATEIERGGTTKAINKAIDRLEEHNGPKVLKVPQTDIPLAEKVAKEKRTHLTISNLSETKKTKV